MEASPTDGFSLDFTPSAEYILGTRPSGRARPLTGFCFEDWGNCMHRLLPSAEEVAIFATLAVICAAIVARFQPAIADLGLAALAGPIFLFAACMGLRRSPAWTIVQSDDPSDKPE